MSTQETGGNHSFGTAQDLTSTVASATTSSLAMLAMIGSRAVGTSI
ncbi:hypothetical protein ACFQX4_22870 [Roseomonas sp. GCM10028921]